MKDSVMMRKAAVNLTRVSQRMRMKVRMMMSLSSCESTRKLSVNEKRNRSARRQRNWTS